MGRAVQPGETVFLHRRCDAQHTCPSGLRELSCSAPGPDQSGTSGRPRKDGDICRLPAPPRWTAITAALTCAVVLGGCGPGHIHQPLSLELGDPASAAGAFSINEDDVYAVALEVRPTGDSAELRGRVRSYFEVSFERPLVAHVVLSRKSPGKAPAVIVEKSISAPISAPGTATP
ncbi:MULTISPECIES: hypothetical protein [Lysobacter]|uniref:hypothetical protein n=1 Tax=Lysobacter TaxID=68 RepID=UPI001F47B48D|nr:MULTISPECIES: hypothetical protein [Lysobacter]UJB19483.1 hypothetical protein L1A79_24835 [Lysobacter capsici]UJQ26791.1 hypothetical protein L2D09_15050 [Lysobacter gummosus]